MKTLRSTFLLGAVTLAFAAGPAAAQLDPLTAPSQRTLDARSDKRLDTVEKTLRELRAIIFQGRDTGKAVIVQPADTQAALDAAMARVQDLEGTLRRVNGQLDNLSTEISAIRREAGPTTAQASDNARNLAATTARLDALERQLTALTAAAVQAQRTPPPPVVEPPRAETEGEAFDNAMRLYTDGQFRASATAFQRYVDDHSRSTDAPEANYYLGQSYYQQKDFDGAALAYINAVSGYPATSWAPDAMVKLAMSLIELRRSADACRTLDEFNTRYPRAPAGVKGAATQARTRARCG